MSVSMRDTKSTMYAEIERMRSVIDKQRVVIDGLQQRVTQLSMPRDSARSFMVPKSVVEAYFAAHPGASRSVSKDALLDWARSQGIN